MAKIRGIKPEFWTDEDIVELSLPARLLFIGLWNLACDNGHVADKPKQIKMRIMPADEVDVDDLIDELAANGRVVRDLGKTITIANFAKHQKPHRRWWTTCDLTSCTVPDDAPEQGFNRGEHPSDTPAQRENNRGATVDHGRTTADVDVEGDGDSESDGEKPRAKRAHQIPNDFAPNDTNRRLAAERGVDLQAAFAAFADYHRSKGSTFKDWHLALNSWIRRERPTRPPSNVFPLSPSGDPILPPPNTKDWLK